jgi:cation-transporting ATPase 13A3/4/5
MSDKVKSATTFTWARVSIIKNILFYLGCIASGGLIPIAIVNYPHLKMLFVCEKCDPIDSEYVRCDDPELGTTHTDVEKCDINEGSFRCFEKYGTRYMASKDTKWEIVEVPHVPERFTDLFVRGLDTANRPSREYLKGIYGLNRMKIDAADAFTITVREMVTPFYLFQYFAVAVWLYTDYIVYSVIVMFITICSIAITVHGKVFNLRRLHELAGATQEIIPYDLTGKNALPKILDTNLVPGDCFIVTPGQSLCCDAILIQGRVVVDESMLTGESVPVSKTPYVWSTIDHDATHRTSNILYSGTVVKSINQGTDAIAMVYRTGYRSQRGELINSLVAPKAEIVQFMPDALNAIIFMVIITTAVFGWSASQLKKLDAVDDDVGIAYLTALTIAVPPGLVACLSIGSALSVARLTYKNIRVADTGKLNAAGYVTYACFDKTGTLTDDKICYEGTVKYNSNMYNVDHIVHQIMASCHSLSIANGTYQGDQLEVELMRVCGWTYSLNGSKAVVTAPLNESDGGKDFEIITQFEFSPEKLRAGTLLLQPDGKRFFLMKGAPEKVVSFCNPSTVPKTWSDDLADLTKKGFRVLAVAFRLVTDSNTLAQDALEKDLVFIGLVYFSNSLKNDTWPSTINSLKNANIHVAMITGDYFSTAKAISMKCHIVEESKPYMLIDATIPDGSNDETKAVICIKNPDTDAIIPGMTIEAMVDKYYSKVRINDTSVNYGNYAFELRSWINHWKRLTMSHVKSDDKLGDIEIGDGKYADCDMQILMTGIGFNVLKTKHANDFLEPIVRMTSVFARMKPADKKSIVEILMRPDSRTDQPKVPCKVLFCGDGANDMEALSASTVGVSLCDTATTIAAAIVSTNQTPVSSVEVLKEGRCSLCTAYLLVNFNIMYAIIQLFMTCYLNNMGLIFGDYMYLIQDLFFSLFLGLAIADIPPSKELSVKMPPQSLFDRGLIVKLFIQLLIFPIFQYIVLEALKQQSWYNAFVVDDTYGPLAESYAFEGAALNIMALAQLMIASVVVTIGRPFRDPFYLSWKHVTLLMIQTGWIFYLLFSPKSEFSIYIDNKPMDHNFSGILIGLICCNAFLSAVCTKIADYFF